MSDGTRWIKWWARGLWAAGAVCLASQAFAKGAMKEPKTLITTNLCMAKGGRGMLNRNLYIDVRSEKNEVVMDEGRRRWVGGKREVREVVVVWHGLVVTGAGASQDYSLADSYVISFEGDRVSFFNFSGGVGGYYLRTSRQEAHQGDR